MRKPDYEREGIKLYCGDCLEILPELSGIDAVVADPPYGIAYCHGARKGGAKMGTDGMAIIGDDKPFDPKPFLEFPIVVLWGANHYASRLPDSSRWLVWDKREGVGSNDQADGEVAWTNCRGVLRLKSRYWNGAQAREKSEPRVHSNQKPIALMEWCIEQVEIKPGSVVMDPFMGSGTTGVACVRQRCKFIGIEKDPQHFATAVKRIDAALDADRDSLWTAKELAKETQPALFSTSDEAFLEGGAL